LRTFSSTPSSFCCLSSSSFFFFFSSAVTSSSGESEGFSFNLDTDVEKSRDPKMLTPDLDNCTVLPEERRDTGSVEGVHDGALHAALMPLEEE
jgi:hypothetical protein